MYIVLMINVGKFNINLTCSIEFFKESKRMSELIFII